MRSVEEELRAALMRALCVEDCLDKDDSWLWQLPEGATADVEKLQELDRRELALAAQGFELAVHYLQVLQHEFLSRVSRDGAGNDFRDRAVADHLRLSELAMVMGLTEQGVHRRIRSRPKHLSAEKQRLDRIVAVEETAEFVERDWGPTSLS